MHVLYVYAASQTYTRTVFEHLDSFAKFSSHEWVYCCVSNFNHDRLELRLFDAIVVHYSVRLVYDQLNDKAQAKLSAYPRLKVLFIQDEYDHTNTAREVIKRVGFHLVFTVVPTHFIHVVYPPEQFPGVRFVNNLTGYAPVELLSQAGDYTPPSNRQCIIAYRGRPLPLRYGKLGQEKVFIGKNVKQYCERNRIAHDIAWDEAARVYGSAWYRFIASSKAMLGSESGSNVFDWDGRLEARINDYKRRHPRASDEEVYQAVVEPCEIDGAMNQISPRIFEMAAARTVMVLFEGEYSGIITPNVHYIPLNKGFSNMDDIFVFLRDAMAVDQMANRAFEDLISSGKYAYQKFVSMVDQEMEAVSAGKDIMANNRSQMMLGRFIDLAHHCSVTSSPYKASPPLPIMFCLTISNNVLVRKIKLVVAKIIYKTWFHIPLPVRRVIKCLLGRS